MAKVGAEQKSEAKVQSAPRHLHARDGSICKAIFDALDKNKDLKLEQAVKIAKGVKSDSKYQKTHLDYHRFWWNKCNEWRKSHPKK